MVQKPRFGGARRDFLGFPVARGAENKPLQRAYQRSSRKQSQYLIEYIYIRRLERPYSAMMNNIQ
jgi:hypothetical protein